MNFFSVSQENNQFLDLYLYMDSLYNRLINRYKNNSNSSSKECIICVESGLIGKNEDRIFNQKDLIDRCNQFIDDIKPLISNQTIIPYFALFMSNSFDSLCLLIALSALYKTVDQATGSETNCYCSTILMPPNLKRDEITTLMNRSKVSTIIIPNDIGINHDTFIQTTTTTTTTPSSSITTSKITLIYSNNRFSIYKTEYIMNRVGEVVADEPTVCQLTSGSTSPSSKISIRTWKSIIEEAEVVAKQLDYTAEDTILVNSAISHSYGLVGGIVSSLLSESLIILPISLDHLYQIDNLSIDSNNNNNKLKVNIMFGVRSSYHWLAERVLLPRCLFESLEASTLRYAMCAGSMIPADLIVQLRSKTGIQLRSNYGTTETGTITIDTTTTGNRSDDENDNVNVSSVGIRLGQLLPHFQYRLSSTEINQDELLLKSTCLSRGYIKDDHIELATDKENWFHTKDHITIASSKEDQQINIFYYQNRIRYYKYKNNSNNNDVFDPVLIEKQLLVHFNNIISDIVLVEDKIFKCYITLVNNNNQSNSNDINSFKKSITLDIEQYISVHQPLLTPITIVIEEILPYSPAGKLLLKYL
ncbi:hypothetical protein PPL_02514 [Heterostelium album PN500]|uniref:AMP-dependent synthetase/ligase domain-containing protein n=1 Tax=Heterostelium pallidum (strain ATCC 26659 / Pp 5 / PN500) TaxID=670386 RepID=D3B2A5_HETP5|nr:hypothetical protein PPL_02514 [Heterostelium album PN500]EFA84480.1 hypothetical protein PPL_02514 [Heterostelium album PN500]|eukprot:XP_020436594.1 hypothetical protein PPL_02514 [Heterostelium album PN500]